VTEDDDSDGDTDTEVEINNFQAQASAPRKEGDDSEANESAYLLTPNSSFSVPAPRTPHSSATDITAGALDCSERREDTASASPLKRPIGLLTPNTSFSEVSSGSKHNYQDNNISPIPSKFSSRRTKTLSSPIKFPAALPTPESSFHIREPSAESEDAFETDVRLPSKRQCHGLFGNSH
jgi:hypothetical protein